MVRSQDIRSCHGVFPLDKKLYSSFNQVYEWMLTKNGGGKPCDLVKEKIAIPLFESKVSRRLLVNPNRANSNSGTYANKPSWFPHRKTCGLLVLFYFIEGFQCPVCHAVGGNAETQCDHNAKYEICNRHNAVCQLTKTIKDRDVLEVRRKCSDRDTFTKEKEDCAKDNNCLNTAYCTDSRCMATLPGKIFNLSMVFLGC